MKKLRDIRTDYDRDSLLDSEISENNVRDSDVIWIIAPWTWNKIPKKVKNQIDKYPMVAVEWYDIVSNSSWTSFDDLKKFEEKFVNN